MTGRGKCYSTRCPSGARLKNTKKEKSHDQHCGRRPAGSEGDRLAGAGFILVAGLVHLFSTPAPFAETAYLGVLFLADFVGSLVAAYGSYRGRRWGWVLGALVAGGAFVAYLLNGTVGLPGVEEAHLLEP
jgi:hypothetical protein